MVSPYFRNCIGYWRIRSGYSQYSLSKILGVSVASISSWENDKSLPSVYFCFRLASIFHCKIEDLFYFQYGGFSK